MDLASPGAMTTFSMDTNVIPRIDKLAFSYETAFKLGCHANLAYQVNTVNAKEVLERWGFPESSFIDGRKLYKDNDTQVYVASSPTVIVVAFRGSEGNVRDWLDTNAQMIRKPLPWLPPGITNGEAHSGFIEALCGKGEKDGQESILDKVVQAIDKFQTTEGPRKQVFLTGHSLGAALATLMAMYLRGILFMPRIQPTSNGGERVEVTNLRRSMPLTVYTLGSPRVMDDVLAIAYDHELRDKTFRIVRNRDIVTQLPPYAWGYTHVGTPIFLAANGTIETDPGEAERALGWFHLKIKNLFEIARTMMIPVGGILDHFIGSGPLTNNGPFPGWIGLFVRDGGYLGALAMGIAQTMTKMPAIGSAAVAKPH